MTEFKNLGDLFDDFVGDTEDLIEAITEILLRKINEYENAPVIWLRAIEALYDLAGSLLQKKENEK